MTVRVRFAPSPTGHVHIGNIRAAIFNWLFARHEGGTFLLRIEDTDRERSTPEAIRTLLECMEWLGLNYDETPVYQTSQLANHLAASERLIAAGHAYRHAKGGQAGEAILFRIPWAAASIPEVSTVGPASLTIHPEVPVKISFTGIEFASVSAKGKPTPESACLAGFQDLRVFEASGACIFELNPVIGDILAGSTTVELANAVRFEFTRRQVAYTDLVKGRLAKPLDSMKDLVIVRSDGNPVFHLANVCDDVTQKITHIIRGDDHVENTYRHIFLFRALAAGVPAYGHLPMIVNQQGKPYSKRDGDAFVGEYREKGFLAQALFNYLALLGWNPGDEREKMSREELVAAFSLDRVQQSSAQMDLRKLENLNGQYLAEMPEAEFTDAARSYAVTTIWGRETTAQKFAEIATFMQSRTKKLTDVLGWDYFFVQLPNYDAKACEKLLGKAEIGGVLDAVANHLRNVPFDPSSIEAAIHAVTDAQGIQQGKFNQPLRVAVTGCTTGAGLYETMAILGRETVLQRLVYARGTYCHEHS